MKNNILSSNDKWIDRLYILVSLLPAIYTVLLLVLSQIDNNGCDELFGGLSSSCHSTTYFLWAFFSIPFSLISLFSLYKNTLPSIIGALLFLIFNIFFLCGSSVEEVIYIEFISILFSAFIIGISLIYLHYKKSNKKPI